MISSQSIYTVISIFLAGYCCTTSVTAFRASVGTINHVSQLLSIDRLRGGGGEIDEYSAQLDTIKSKIMIKAGNDIETLRVKIEDEGKIILDLGAKADAIVQGALIDFASMVEQPNTNNPVQVSQYDLKIQEINTLIDSPLHVLYLQQLCILRTNALQEYRISTKSNPTTSDYETMLNIDTKFVQDAITSSRSNWDYSKERQFLQSIMNHIADSNKRSIDVQVTSAQQQQTAMSFLQSQQQMIQQLQMQLYGQTSPWNIGVAYRIPDTNFNLNGSYQQGRANIQLSCVPDEYAPMLGPNGFTNGVGPGNLGLSLNLSI
jgi:hypothetical protein